MASLVLYGRHACHLCDVMQQELGPMLQEFNCELRVEDVDSRADWQQRYGQLVPVLETPDGVELCHYHLDESAVYKWLSAQR